MKVFRELTIQGAESVLRDCLAVIEARLSVGWERDAQEEQRQRGRSPNPNAIERCFKCSAIDGRPAASLWLVEQYWREAESVMVLYVSNVVPAPPRSQLSRDEYNGIVEEFYSRFVRPAEQESGAQANLGEEVKSIEAWLSPEAAAKLRAFSSRANRSTGSAHPLDEQRWQDLIRAAHDESSPLDGHTLRRWLCEDEGWPEAVVSSLVGEYEFGRALLAREPAGASA